ncbi:hypothetical protein ACQR18_29260 [Bradyrhizobium oligotrophicum]|uniref:hypothetical protein n=1 Tax=Bradyrhizobium oligotrophicum TaxID=44255 RepID=UPI003EB951EA
MKWWRLQTGPRHCRRLLDLKIGRPLEARGGRLLGQIAGIERKTNFVEQGRARRHGILKR